MANIKRVLCLVLTLVLIISLTPSVFADNTSSTDEYLQFIETACDVFPEYADRIYSTPSSADLATCSLPQIVESVSRTSANGDILTYIEYSDGVVVLSSANVLNTNSYHNVINSTTTDYYLSFKVTANVSYEVLTISNICYRLSNGKSSILSRGTGTRSSGGPVHYASEYRQSEGHLTNACTGFTCDLARNDGYPPIEVTFMFYVTGNRWWTNAGY